MSPSRNPSGTLLPKSPPMNAATTEGGAIQATIRQSTRPARACVIPPTSAVTALTAMFVPAAAAAFPEASSTAGRRRLPRTSPTAEPSTRGDERAAGGDQRDRSRAAPRHGGAATSRARPAGTPRTPRRSAAPKVGSSYEPDEGPDDDSEQPPAYASSTGRPRRSACPTITAATARYIGFRTYR